MSPTLHSSRLINLYKYWDRKRQGRRLPARNDISPAELKDLLDRLFLVNVERNPYRFRYRLGGSALYQFTGGDITGRYLDAELAGANFPEIFEAHVKTVETQLPHFGISAYIRPQNSTGTVTVEAIFLPLSTNGTEVDMLLCTQDILVEGWVPPAVMENLLRERWTLIQASTPLLPEHLGQNES